MIYTKNMWFKKIESKIYSPKKNYIRSSIEAIEEKQEQLNFVVKIILFFLNY